MNSPEQDKRLIVDPDELSRYFPNNWQEQLLFDCRSRDFVRLENSGIYAPKTLDLSHEDAAEIFVEHLDFASSKHGLMLPKKVLSYIGGLFTETIVATINYFEKLTEPAFDLFKSWSEKQQIQSWPVSVIFLRGFETGLNHLYDYYTSVLYSDQYTETHLKCDELVTSDLINASCLFAPFIGTGSRNLGVKDLIREGQSASLFIAQHHDSVENRAVAEYLAKNYHKTYFAMDQTRRYLRF